MGTLRVDTPPPRCPDDKHQDVDVALAHPRARNPGSLPMRDDQRVVRCERCWRMRIVDEHAPGGK